jgi:molecular chaperone GrpE (heat shock protein)
MNNEKNITALLDIITEQRETISTLKDALDKAKSDSSNYRRWWIDSLEKTSENASETTDTQQS